MQRTLLVLALIGAASAADEDLIGALNGDLGLGEHFVPLSGETAESLWTATQVPPTPSAAPATQSGGAGYSVSLVASAASATQSGDTVDRVALVRRRRSGAPGQPLAAGETDVDRLVAALGQPLAAAETVPTAAPPMLPATAAAAPVTPTNIGAAHLGQPLAAGTPAKAAPAAVALAGVMPQAVAQSVAKAAAVPQFHPGHFAWSIAEIQVRREPAGNFRHLLSVNGREVSNRISANVPELLIGSTIFDYDAGTLTCDWQGDTVAIGASQEYDGGNSLTIRAKGKGWGKGWGKGKRYVPLGGWGPYCGGGGGPGGGGDAGSAGSVR